MPCRLIGWWAHVQIMNQSRGSYRPGSERENSGSGHFPGLHKRKPVKYVHNLISGRKVQILDYMVEKTVPRSCQKEENKDPVNGLQLPIYFHMQIEINLF